MAIFFDKGNKTFYLESKDITYAFKIDECGFLEHLYFGKRIARDDLSYGVYAVDRGHGTYLFGTGPLKSLNQHANECPTYGRSDFRESMIALCDEAGVRVADFVYFDHAILPEKPILDGMPSVRGKETLAVRLKDARMGVTVTLFYTVFEDLPIILRHAEIANDGNLSVSVERAYSFCLDFPDKDWQAITLPGAHTRERFLERTRLSHGVFAVDSKRGISSLQMNPFAAFVRSNTDENVGEAYGINLVYSGDFVIKAQIEETDTLRVVGGINDYDFAWELHSGEKFITPEAVLVYSAYGLGNMSRALHDLYREYLIPRRYVNEPRPIVLNSWESVYFDFDSEKLCEMMDRSAGTGIDTFVLDDGWFGVRNDDTSGLGDWNVNQTKLPGGLTPLIEHAHKNGLKFGLWIEPEMVNPDSDLYRAHPDWVIGAPAMKPCLGRHQLVLDLSRDEVCDYIIESIAEILHNNHVDYVKWDMNRPLTDNYSVQLGKRSKELHHRYVLGLYKICDALVHGFPQIFFEGCSSGGGRFDPAMLYYFPQIWTSDNSDAYIRTMIQYGTSMCYPLSSMSCHVSECPNHQCGRITPFSSRGGIAHLGATGYELNIGNLSEHDREQVRLQVEEYKKMQALVLQGDLYRLNNPFHENLFAMEIVSKDKSHAHITAMRPISISNDKCIRIYPRGLDENATYRVAELNLIKKGSTLMHYGLIAEFEKVDFALQTFTFVRENE